MDASDERSPDEAATLGKIQLTKQAVDSTEYVAHRRAALRRGDRREVTLLNRLVPYLDLFGRLNDRELARLADVPELTVVHMREQIVQVRRKLGGYESLLDRLDDTQLARVAETSPKMFQYLRLCQPRQRSVTPPSTTRAARLRALTPPGEHPDGDATPPTLGEPTAETMAATPAASVASASDVAPTSQPNVPQASESDTFEFTFVDDEE